jgi:hypothetical protein
MAFRLISFCGLLVLGMVSFPVNAAIEDAANCAGALHRAFATQSDKPEAMADVVLPEPCRSIGPVKLGMTRSEVLAALGHPDQERTSRDHPETADVLYVYPRDLNAQLARNPLPADKINYSQLGVRFQDGKVTNIVTFANLKAPLPFKLLGRAAGSDIGDILKEMGGSPEWNASHDYIQFQSMPIGLSIDPATSGIVGLDIANQKRDLDTFSVQGLTLTKDKKAGLFSGFLTTR